MSSERKVLHSPLNGQYGRVGIYTGCRGVFVSFRDGCDRCEIGLIAAARQENENKKGTEQEFLFHSIASFGAFPVISIAFFPGFVQQLKVAAAKFHAQL